MQIMGDGAGISVIKVRHMFVCAEWVCDHTKPGGTAGYVYSDLSQQLLYGTGFLFVRTP